MLQLKQKAGIIASLNQRVSHTRFIDLRKRQKKKDRDTSPSSATNALKNCLCNDAVSNQVMI